MSFSRLCLLLFLGAFFSFGLAQRCTSELLAGTDASTLDEVATGRDAVVYLKRAVDLLEPALPPLIQVRGGPLPEDDPLAGTVQFLAERKLLPMSWQPDTLEAGAWQWMLEAFASWYGIDTPVVSGEALTHADMVADLSDIIGRAGPGLKPVALVASASDDRDRVAFWSIIRNDSVYPRMIVVRPPGEEVSLAAGIEGSLPALSSCAFSVDNFVFASAETAQRLFLANSDARMVIAQRQPSASGGLEYVPLGEETAYFTFSTPALADVASYAALFVGPSVPITTLFSIIPQLRTNMSPREIISFVSAP